MIGNLGTWLLLRELYLVDLMSWCPGPRSMMTPRSSDAPGKCNYQQTPLSSPSSTPTTVPYSERVFIIFSALPNISLKARQHGYRQSRNNLKKISLCQTDGLFFSVKIVEPSTWKKKKSTLHCLYIYTCTYGFIFIFKSLSCPIIIHS